MAKPTLFTDDDLATFHAALDELRAPGSYSPGRWNVSALNRRADIVGGAFPQRIILRDISLRTIEQMPGILRSEDERLSFLRKLVSAGVPEVNTSGFLRRRTLEEMKSEVATVKEISEACQLVYLGPVTAEDFALTAKAGYDYVQLMSSYLGAATPVLSPPTYHRMWHQRDWRSLRFPKSPQEQIDRSVRLTRMALDHGLKVSAGMNLVSYASERYIQDYCGAVSEAGAQEIALLDSSSSLGPEAYAHIVGTALAAAGDSRIAIHAHDMFGLAVASNVAAARAGAVVLEVAVNGYVIGPPQADLAATAVALEALYGVSTGIDLARLVDIARTGEAFTGVPVAPNYPVVGRELFALGEADQYVEEVDVDPLLHKPYTPELVGNTRPLLITSTTGPFGMWRKMEQLGIEAEREDVAPILQACWEFIMTMRRPIQDAEIAAVARIVMRARSKN